MHLYTLNQNNFWEYKMEFKYKNKKISALLINTRNANAFTGKRLSSFKRYCRWIIN